jgi:hypothetical protein
MRMVFFTEEFSMPDDRSLTPSRVTLALVLVVVAVLLAAGSHSKRYHDERLPLNNKIKPGAIPCTI